MLYRTVRYLAVTDKRQILDRPVRFCLHDDKKNTTFLHNWI